MRNDSLIQSKIKSLKFPFFLSGTRKVWPVHTHTHIHVNVKHQEKRCQNPSNEWWGFILIPYQTKRQNQNQKKGGEKNPNHKKHRQRKLQYAIREKKKGKGTRVPEKLGGCVGEEVLLTRGVSQLPFTLKSILRQKKNMETQIFHHSKI